MIKSPYNFVPAPKENEVFEPEWADQVSHDIPFSDGESGEIEFTITSETPIFIRNGHSKPAEGEKPTDEFSHYLDKDGNKKYFIPATSIKGMLRNVLEIMSRSRMIQVDNNHHAIRQIMQPKSVLADEGYELAKNEKKNIKAGWLIRKDDNYILFSCGEPLKIRYTDLDSKLKTNFGGHFGESKLTDLSNFDNKTGAYKYLNLLNGKSLEHRFEIHPLEDDGQNSWISKFQHLKYARFHDKTNSESNSFEGTIVCTGQATDYISNKTARKGEYVFRGKISELSKSNKGITLSKEVVDTFKFINRNNKPDELKDWSYWKNKEREGIPVFFRWQEENKSIKDMGLTFMYKTPAENDIHDLLPHKFEKGKLVAKTLDLAETIFGNVRNEKLKGRVFISNAKLFENTKVNILPEVKVALSNPKSSFYPNYLKQNGNNGATINFATYNTGGELRGIKRYPVKTMLIDNQGTDEMSTIFKPLDKGSKFLSKIRFHNLRKVEIGALLSSLTFHGNNENLFHSIGMGKPLGYGVIKIDNPKLSGLQYDSIEYIKAFELEMRLFNSEWGNDKFIKELFAMASINDEPANISLQYPSLEDFQKYKNEGLYLKDYSEITSANPKFDYYASNEEYKLNYEIRNKEKIEKEKLRQDWELNRSKVINSNNEETIRIFLKDCPFDDLKSGLESILNKIVQENEIEKTYQQALISTDIEYLKLYIAQNPSRKGIEEVKRHLKELIPQVVPERLINGNLTSEQFLKEAIVWKNKNMQIFPKYEEQLKERFLVLAKGQRIEKLKIKIESLFSNPQSLYDKLTRP